MGGLKRLKERAGTTTTGGGDNNNGGGSSEAEEIIITLPPSSSASAPPPNEVIFSEEELLQEIGVGGGGGGGLKEKEMEVVVVATNVEEDQGSPSLLELIGVEDRQEGFQTPKRSLSPAPPARPQGEEEGSVIDDGFIQGLLDSEEQRNNNIPQQEVRKEPVYCKVNFDEVEEEEEVAGEEEEGIQQGRTRRQVTISRKGNKAVVRRPRRKRSESSSSSVPPRKPVKKGRRATRSTKRDREEEEEDEKDTNFVPPEEEEEEDEEEEDDQDQEDSFDLESTDMDDFGERREPKKRSSYSGIRGPRADAKALNLITNCPFGVKWLLDNFEYYPGRSLPRGFVYDQYVLLCNENSCEPVNAASFGKMIRSVFPGLKTRRLGTRGNSKYHYNGVYLRDDSPLRAIFNLIKSQHELNYDGSGKRGRKVRRAGMGGDETLLPVKDEVLEELSIPAYFTGIVKLEMPLLRLQLDVNDVPPNLDPKSVTAFEKIYKNHCEMLLNYFEKLELKQFFEEWKRFWRVKCYLPPPPSSEEEDAEESMPMPYSDIMVKATLFKLCSLKPVQDFVVKMDLYCYQGIINMLFPCFSRAMPMSLINAMRNFTRDVETGMFYSLDGYPLELVGEKMRCLHSFIGKFNEFSKLNRMMKAAACTLRNEDNVRAMQTELNRSINFGKIQERIPKFLKITETLVLDKLMLSFHEVLDQSGPNIQTIKLWIDWASDVAQRVIEETERKVLDGEIREGSLPLENSSKVWETTSKGIMGAIYMSNAVSHAVFKGFLVWCDNLVKHFVKMEVSRRQGFENPIFYEHQQTPPYEFKQVDPLMFQPVVMQFANPDGNGQAIHVQFHPMEGNMEMHMHNQNGQVTVGQDYTNVQQTYPEGQEEIYVYQDGQVYLMETERIPMQRQTTTVELKPTFNSAWAVNGQEESAEFLAELNNIVF